MCNSMPPVKHLLPILLALTSVTARADAPLNPGFEDGPTGWAFSEKIPMSTVVPEAAHGGSKGLRITDNSAEAGSSAVSGKIPVTPGAALELEFYARTQTQGFVGVYLWFRDADGKLIKEESQRAGQGHPVVGVKNADGQWGACSLKATAPATASSVSIWIHSFGKATGSADLDDFSLMGAAGQGAAAEVAPTPAPVVLPGRSKPPLIVLKTDDLRPINGKVHPLWDKLVGYLDSKNIKASIGILMDKTGEATPAYFDWVKQKHAGGNIEFWFHGWDHATHEVDGVKYNEFNKRSYEEQKKRFDDAQKLAKESFGFPFVTFGPPGGTSNGTFDENTVKVMADEPDMKVWLYPQPLDNKVKDLAAGGKVTILDRVWAVNLESKVGNPDFQKFLEGYAKNPGREYFVLQGHPMSWGSAEKYAEFTKIIDFLIEQKAEFLTPTELAARLKSR
jgi:peptidoglycan/xylan/chitin deacetylase (PgdA/CDA1 family)